MNTLRSALSRSSFCRTFVLLIACLCVRGGLVRAQNAGIPQSFGNRLVGSSIILNASVDATCPPQGEKAATIRDVVSFNIDEENPAFLSDNFTATVTVTIVYGDNAGSTTAMPNPVTLTVNYSKDAGISYDTKKYISFTGARYVKATVTGITPSPATLSNGVNVLSLLTLKSEIQATLYFDLNANLLPASLPQPASPCAAGGTVIPDELPVSWSWPTGALNNGTQLEWTFVPGDVTTNYTNSDGSPNYTLLFKNNSTRVDLPLGVVSYNIPLFYDGSGTIYYRIRAVNNLSSGSRSDGPWANGQPVTFCGHSPALNWQVYTVFAEDGKRKTVMRYYDGSLRMRQTVTKDNSTNTTLTEETFYDGQGRPAIEILPAPGINNIVAYTQNLNTFNGQTPGTDPAALFDLQPVSGGNNATPPLSATTGTSLYYNAANPEISQNGNGNIPDAGGYSYSVTRYTPDATGRVMTESGVGTATKMASGHETKYFYGNAPQEQLDGLFGTEVGISPHYFKDMIQDANGQMTVNYSDMHGRTIATALAGDPASLQTPVDLTQYPGQGASTLTQNLLPTGANLIKGNSLESMTTLLVPAGTDYNFSYSLAPDALTLQNCQGTQNICYDCMYNLEITITDESGDTDPIVRRFDNVSLSSANVCPPGNPLLTDDHFSATALSTVSGSNITFLQHLSAGSWSVRKTLTVSDAAMQTLRDQYVSTGLCKDQQGIIDSIYNVLQAQTNCAVPKAACTSCGVNTLDVLQSEMLADMMPFSGQYAKDPSTIVMQSNSYKAYDIFYTNHFRSPSGGPYLDAAGNPDASISSTLSTITPADFEGVFAPSWAQELLPYHPEYHELVFAQQHLVSSYSFIDGFNSVTTYGTTGAYQNQYNTTEDLDPFFTQWTDMKSYMHNLSSVGGYYNNLSLWQIAYGSVTCTNNPDPQAVDNCYLNCPKSPQSFVGVSQVALNQMWAAYQGLYTSVRDSLVNIYIKNNGTPPDQTALINDQYILRFPSSNSQVFTQYHFTGFPATAGDPPSVSLTDLATAAQTTQCGSYIDRWKQALLQCPALAARSDANDILTEITTRMVAVCERGQDAANPYGSSSVAPANTIAGGDNSFEDVINNVFNEKGISLSQLCNPFAIDFPKPYGKNPQVIKEIMTVVDKCACDQFAKLKTQAGVSTFTELNTWLLATYGDTISYVEYAAMQNCSIIDGTSKCKQVPYTVPLNPDGSCPCQQAAFAASASSKTSSALAVGAQPNATVPTSCTCYQQVCRVVDAYPLSSPQPKPAFLDCGFTGYSHCVTCSQLSAYITSYKALFGSQPCAAAPITGTTDLTSDQIGYNVTFAQYVNYMSGLQLNWTDYINAAAATSCNLATYASNGGANQTVVCGNAKPLSDPSALIETEDPCQKTHQMAIAMGQEIYQQRVAALQTSFDQWYASKCLTTTETFNVVYTVKEFHYTLYYYDQAGNLVKTVSPKGARPNFSTAFINSVEAARTTGDVVTPAHLLPTDYRFNSLNLVVAQHSPDANTTHFWYDNLGRLVVSQNAQQAVDGKYSYTIYDAISRVVEIGQKPQSQAMSQAISQSTSLLSNWLLSAGGTREQVTSTTYDQRAAFISTSLIDGLNLRNRVSYTTTMALITDAQWNATIYSYDVHGNVDTVLQDYGAVTGIGGDQYKRITYDYDLVSNKINGMDYQHGLGQDAFYHRYRYDAENRLVQVLTSRDSIFWEQEAAYDYYKHGPLARTVLGQLQTQELRYSYTLQGWLKGINSGGLFNYVPPSSGTSDGSNCAPGTYPDNLVVSSRPASGGPATYEARTSITFQEGFTVAAGDVMTALIDPNASACVITPASGSGGIIPTDPLSFPIAQDAYNFSLHYYPGDYTPISATTPVTGVLEAIPSQAAPLYNGNIAAMAVNLPLTSDGTKVYNYHYDQLNRLTQMDAFNGLNTVNHTFSPVQLQDYKEQVKYDPNGNILTYLRNGYQGGGYTMDNLTYNYNHATTNQLSSITDAAGGTYTEDIKDQGTGDHYIYDQIGNLIADGSNSISWTVYGKIAAQAGISGTISNVYDASSNRITKSTSSITTLYARDAQGNVLTTYQRGTSGAFAQSEIDLYGGSRLGLTRAPALPSQTITLTGGSLAYVTSFTRGLKSYELSNHLGNVLATITDKKIAVSSGSNSSLIDHFTADVVTAQDYYPFGMIMPGRSYTASGASDYMYGFNGKEDDNEVKGVGNQIDYGTRVYDPRLGRFLSMDPMSKSFPWYTPYQFAGNKPIANLDLDGLEEKSYLVNLGNGKTQIQLLSEKKLTDGWFGWKWTQKPIPERYVFQAGGLTYYVGFTGETRGAGNNSKGQLALARYFAEKGAALNLGGKFLNAFFNSEDESYKIWRGDIKDGQYKSSWANVLVMLSNAGLQALMDVASAKLVNYKGFSKGQLNEHYEKHVIRQNEFGDITKTEYQQLAKNFAREEAESIDETVAGNFYVKYDRVTRRTLITHLKDREIRTFYIADKMTQDPFAEAVELAIKLSKKN